VLTAYGGELSQSAQKLGKSLLPRHSPFPIPAGFQTMGKEFTQNILHSLSVKWKTYYNFSEQDPGDGWDNLARFRISVSTPIGIGKYLKARVKDGILPLWHLPGHPDVSLLHTASGALIRHAGQGAVKARHLLYHYTLLLYLPNAFKSYSIFMIDRHFKKLSSQKLIQQNLL